MESVPLVFEPRSAWPSLGLLAITTIGAAFGVRRAHRKRLVQLEEEARAVPPSPAEGPAGAYRRPPLRALSGQVDPEVLQRARARTRAFSALGVLSTAAAAALAVGRSPWPVPLALAAWVAVVGLFVGSMAERA
jgi:hypothetical protein